MIQQLFPSLIFQQNLGSNKERKKLHQQLLIEIWDIAELDTAGIAWSKKHYPYGFTSYASANELHKQSSTFTALESMIDKQVNKFIKNLEYDLKPGSIKMDTCWVNIMNKGAAHAWHTHPLAVISGTYYLQMPTNSRPIHFQDPRVDFYMNMPPRLSKTKKINQQRIGVPAKEGDLILFESWLKHEVPKHREKKPRISISFNYNWI